MSKLKETVEFIALNDSPGDKGVTVEDLRGWLSVATAAIALGRPATDIADRVFHFRENGSHQKQYIQRLGRGARKPPSWPPDC